MAENTSIEWATHTFNHVRGCTKVAEGCKFCYAETQSKRFPNGSLGIWGPNGKRVVPVESYWNQPLKWNRWNHECTNCGMSCFHEGEHPGEVRSRCCNANAIPRRPRVFCASLADVFEDWDGPMVDHKGNRLSTTANTDQWFKGSKQIGSDRYLTMSDVRRRLFDLIDATPNLDWLLVTKRPENVRKMWPDFDETKCYRCGGHGIVTAWSGSLGNHSLEQTADDCPVCTSRNEKHRKNVWLLTSASTQADAEKNIPELLKCRDLVPVLGISAEPLLEAIRLSHLPDRHWHHGSTIDPLTGGGLQIMGDGGAGIVARGPRRIDWVIAGGESGNQARPCNVDWIRDLRDQCQSAGVPFFAKQLGAVPYVDRVYKDSWALDRERKQLAPGSGYRILLDDKKGGDESEWPDDLQGCREFPQTN